MSSSTDSPAVQQAFDQPGTQEAKLNHGNKYITKRRGKKHVRLRDKAHTGCVIGPFGNKDEPLHYSTSLLQAGVIMQLSVIANMLFGLITINVIKR